MNRLFLELSLKNTDRCLAKVCSVFDKKGLAKLRAR